MLCKSASPSRSRADGADVLNPRRSDDELLAYTLIHIWALTSGRFLRTDIYPADLTEDELIDFWADPLFEAES